jgi:RHS repeat-associated protein
MSSSHRAARIGRPVTFKYNVFGRRIQKVFTQNSTTTTTNYVYNGDDTVEETDQNGNLLAKYARTLNIDEPLAESRSGTTSYYEQDGLGSVTSLTSAAGALANTYTFDSFGKTTNSTGSLTNPFRYTGRDFDSETSIYYYRARYYDPQSGRFISEDPLGFSSGIDFYAYVRNRPLNYVDPSGFQPSGIGWSCLWKWGNRLRNLTTILTCTADCLNWLLPTCDNSKAIGQAQAGSPLNSVTPGDLANQGNTNYVGAPSASEGYRQFQMASAGNKNIKSCAENCVSQTPVLGMLPH